MLSVLLELKQLKQKVMVCWCFHIRKGKITRFELLLDVFIGASQSDPGKNFSSFLGLAYFNLNKLIVTSMQP